MSHIYSRITLAFAFTDTKFVGICIRSTNPIVNNSIQLFIIPTRRRFCCGDWKTSSTFTFAVIIEHGVWVTIAIDVNSASQTSSRTVRALICFGHFSTWTTSASTKLIWCCTVSTSTIWYCVEHTITVNTFSLVCLCIRVSTLAFAICACSGESFALTITRCQSIQWCACYTTVIYCSSQGIVCSNQGCPSYFFDYYVMEWRLHCGAPGLHSECFDLEPFPILIVITDAISPSISRTIIVAALCRCKLKKGIKTYMHLFHSCNFLFLKNGSGWWRFFRRWENSFLRLDVPSSKVVINIKKERRRWFHGNKFIHNYKLQKHKCMIYQSEWNNIFSFGWSPSWFKPPKTL